MGRRAGLPLSEPSHFPANARQLACFQEVMQPPNSETSAGQATAGSRQGGLWGGVLHSLHVPEESSGRAASCTSHPVLGRLDRRTCTRAARVCEPHGRQATQASHHLHAAVDSKFLVQFLNLCCRGRGSSLHTHAPCAGGGAALLPLHGWPRPGCRSGGVPWHGSGGRVAGRPAEGGMGDRHRWAAAVVAAASKQGVC